MSFESKFAKDLRNIRDEKMLAKVKCLILESKQAESLAELKNAKKLQGHETYYRIRIGDYRVGVELVDGELIFARLLHRKDIYKYFP